jgi:hypothetical protein
MVSSSHVACLAIFALVMVSFVSGSEIRKRVSIIETIIVILALVTFLQYFVYLELIEVNFSPKLQNIHSFNIKHSHLKNSLFGEETSFTKKLWSNFTEMAYTIFTF